MQIQIVINDTTIQGSLDNTSTAREFAALLPLSVTLADFHGTERIADLPRRLTTTDAPPGTEPHAGDITYYAPWGREPCSTATSPTPTASSTSATSTPTPSTHSPD
jgi:hypothetical protein